MKNLLILALLSTSIFATELTIKVANIKGNQGHIGFAIFEKSNAAAFPSKSEAAVYREFIKISELPLKIKLNQGSYAVTLFHDVNDDMELNTNSIGIPKEPFGFSNNPKLLFGPPTFSKAQINLNQNSKEITIDLKTF